MSYLVIARKYRPGTFASVIGQKHVTVAIGNAISRGQIAHAYVFSGPRGVGKTSIARILAKALNCAKGPTAEPCGECSACLEVTSGRSLGVREIDGASHNSVDNVRELIESFRSLPPPGYKYKVYIIDEVHMLSTSAFNALLKSLEEPPPNTVFILATTEKHKIPKTVLSRCQEYEFKALATSEIIQSLKLISESENLKVEPEVLQTIARLADGSMRDAQTLLDRVKAFCGDIITSAQAADAIGIVNRATLKQLVDLIIAHDAKAAIDILSFCLSDGRDINLLLREFVAYWRDLLLAAYISDSVKIGCSPEEFKELEQQNQLLDKLDLQDLVEIARTGSDLALRSAYPRYALESLIIRMCTRLPVRDLSEVINNLRDKVKNNKAVVSSNAPSTKPISETLVKNEITEKKITTPELSQTSEIDWNNFVEFVSKDGSMMLAEQLKRVRLEHASEQKLSLRGPEFSIAYIQNRDNLDKFNELLLGFTQTSWKIELLTGESGMKAEPGSIVEKEQTKRSTIMKVKTDNLKNHPSVKKIQAVFPGSVIEDLKLKK